MICFKKIKPRKVKKAKKNKAGQEALDKLNSFIDKESPAPAFFLARTWSDQQKSITYKELRQAILNGYMDEETLSAWQQDYSVYVNKYMAPAWYKAMEAAASDLSIAGESFRYDPMWTGITDWVRDHTAQFVTNASNEQKQAISALVARAYNSGQDADELSRAIRPCIGLTQRQAIANQKYYENKKKEFLKNEPNLSEKKAEERAREEAAKYAERQHRYRAQVIVETEMAYAYNEGHYQSIKMAQAQGLLGEVHKKWCTAADELVCGYCGSLEGTEIDVDDKFRVTNGKKTAWVLYPPAHPSCRCAFEEVEVSPPKPMPQNTYQYPDHGEQEIGNQNLTIQIPLEVPDPVLDILDRIGNMIQQEKFSDVTDKWISEATQGKGKVTDSKSYTTGGIKYNVDNKHVILDYSAREKEVADLIAEETGMEVHMVPRVLNPKGIQTPDYLIAGERFDLKEPTGQSKNLLYNMLAKKKKQADNFVIDIAKCSLEEMEIVRQIGQLYTYKHTKFIRCIILIDGDRILHIFERTEE